MNQEPPGTLRLGEPHPSAHNALDYIVSLGINRLSMLQESFSSCAIDGNRYAEVCSETLRRVMACEPVSDRYALGLAWAIRDMEESTSDPIPDESVRLSSLCRQYKMERDEARAETIRTREFMNAGFAKAKDQIDELKRQLAAAQDELVRRDDTRKPLRETSNKLP